MAEKSIAEGKQRLAEAVAEAVAGGEAFFAAGFAPALECAVRGRRARPSESAGVNDEPEDGEPGIVFVIEDLPQVGFDVCGTGEALVISQEAEALPVVPATEELLSMPTLPS
jgi:hypothetical protein